MRLAGAAIKGVPLRRSRSEATKFGLRMRAMDNKTLLVTGGSRGIGRATALAAAKDGWRVAVNYAQDESAAREVVEAIRAGGGAAVALKGDVANEADVLALFAGAAELGPLGGVVVNAGV